MLQGSWPLQIVAVADGFALLYRENLRGKLVLRVLRLDDAGAPQGEPVRVNAVYDEIEDAPRNGRMVHRQGTLAVLWANERRQIIFRALGADGTPLSPQKVAVSGVGPNATLGAAVATAEGYALAWGDNRGGGYRYLPYFARLDGDGALIGSDVRVTAGSTPEQYPRLGELSSDRDGFALTWSEREAGDDDRLYVSYLANDGKPTGAATLLYQAEDVIVTTGSLADRSGGERIVSLWDLDRGSGLLRLGGQPTWPAALAEVERPRLANAAENAVAVLGGTEGGVGEQAKRVFFALVDPDDGRAGSASVFGGETPGACIEGYTMAPAKAGFAVVWIEGCNQRRLYFTRLR